ncbi:transcription initiation factor IIB [Halorubrum lipolyticum]|uniref:Transcription initiation factor IIB n=1 Tax=Halorubrum lipolyticum DSM 21995 TaxID=1227482 RepID=M0NSU0_9EURY|nr:transcription initiation factor IIB family protein [Halorubrum lipolyticum]EMA60841.1 transcription factor TFIIB cyclin-related protein [Halorubrum lipolyticum DSM 21995]
MSEARPTQTRSPRTETDDAATANRAATADRTAATEQTETADADAPAARETCPECGGRTRVDSAERVCADCGLVVEADRIDHGPEWRSFDDDDANPKRTGAPLTRSRHDRGLSTEIGRSTRVKGRKRRRLARMRTQHNRAQISTKRDRNKVYAYTEIRRLTGVLELPDSVRDTACTLFDSAQDESLLRGRSLEGFAAACVYVACRTADVARTVEEICGEAKATVDEHQAAFDAMNRELGLPIAPTGPAEYLPRFASDLDCDAGVERRAGELAERAVEEGIANGRNPVGVAAACLYTAARELDAECTQQEAADAAGVTPVTVRRTYVDLTEE